tara:strand:- start:175 stop:465 length:291 start_codon:yes stop_codon:yes gene_type:complete
MINKLKEIIIKSQQSSLFVWVGWFACVMACVMYLSYIDQIRLNLSGQPGSVILPLVTIINCAAWIIYAATKTKKDWPVLICNIPGVILGLITVITA